jgi:hypothetical protein
VPPVPRRDVTMPLRARCRRRCSRRRPPRTRCHPPPVRRP